MKLFLLTMDQVLVISINLKIIGILVTKRETRAQLVFLSKCTCDKCFCFLLFEMKTA